MALDFCCCELKTKTFEVIKRILLKLQVKEQNKYVWCVPKKNIECKQLYKL